MSNESEEPIVSKVKLYNEIGVPFSGECPTGMDRLRSSYIEQQKKLKKKNETNKQQQTTSFNRTTL